MSAEHPRAEPLADASAKRRLSDRRRRRPSIRAATFRSGHRWAATGRQRAVRDGHRHIDRVAGDWGRGRARVRDGYTGTVARRAHTRHRSHASSGTLRGVRQLRELADVSDPAWPALADVLLDAAPTAQILPVEREAGERCLLRLQVTASSTLGALALHTGGVAIDNGWLRILGGGHNRLADLGTVNGLSELSSPAPPPILFVAFDVLGGRFAINGGGLGGALGEVNYWGPDLLVWQPIGFRYSDFVCWSLSDEMASFYRDLRWDGWQDEVAQVGLDAALSVYPPLCAAESRPIDETARRSVPWAELSAYLDELARLPDGPVRFSIGP